MRLKKIALIIILVIILAAAIFRHSLCRHLITDITAKATGLKLSIGRLNWDVLKSSILMQDIALYSHSGFQNEAIGKADRILVKYDLLGSLGGQLHLRELIMDISEINIIRNEQGISNVASFKQSLPSAKPDASPIVSPAKSQQAKRPNYLIDRLEFSLGKVAYIDYSAPVGESAVIIFTVDGPIVHQNVTSLTKVAESVSVKGGFKNLLNNLLGSVAKNDIIKSTGERIKLTGETIKERLKGPLKRK